MFVSVTLKASLPGEVEATNTFAYATKVLPQNKSVGAKYPIIRSSVTNSTNGESFDYTQKNWGKQESTDPNYWTKRSPASPELAPAPVKGTLPESTQLVSKPRITGYVVPSIHRYGMRPSYSYRGYPSSYGDYDYGNYYPDYRGYSRSYYPTYTSGYRQTTYFGVGVGLRIGGGHCGLSHRHSRHCR